MARAHARHRAVESTATQDGDPSFIAKELEGPESRPKRFAGYTWRALVAKLLSPPNRNRAPTAGKTTNDPTPKIVTPKLITIFPTLPRDLSAKNSEPTNSAPTPATQTPIAITGRPSPTNRPHAATKRPTPAPTTPMPRRGLLIGLPCLAAAQPKTTNDPPLRINRPRPTSADLATKISAARTRTPLLRTTAPPSLTLECSDRMPVTSATTPTRTRRNPRS